MARRMQRPRTRDGLKRKRKARRFTDATRFRGGRLKLEEIERKLIEVPSSDAGLIAGDHAFVCGGDCGLFVLDISDPTALELIGPECIELMNREENLNLNLAPTIFMEFHGTTTSQLAEVLEMAAAEAWLTGGLPAT